MPLQCPAPGCTTTFDDEQENNVLMQLLELHSRTAHPPTPTQAPAPRIKAEQVKRPTVTASGTSETWRYFTQRWTVYKQATKLEGADIIYQLLECLDEPLRKDITRTYGTLTEDTEDTVLEYIRTLAVCPENTMIARFKLQQLHQDRDEPIRSFLSRLKGQASVCKYLKKCPCQPPQDVDYSTEIIRDALIKGIDDEDIKIEVMGQANQEMTLDEVVQFVEAKESGKRSANRLQNSASATASVNSNYRRNKTQNQQMNTDRPPEQYNTTRPPESSPFQNPRPCGYCGQKDHSGNRSQRFQKCPAFNTKCNKCGRLHHFGNMCRRHRNTNKQSHHEGMNDDSGVIFDELCTSSDIHPVTTNSITLEHHIFNELHQTWQRKNSASQPTLKLHVRADPLDVKNLGFQTNITYATPNVPYPAVTDTGCQSCLSGVDLLYKIGLNRSHLIPVSMKMKAANNEGINIMGALPLQVSGVTPPGETIITHQLVYFSDQTNRLFLSKQACLSLGIISEKFPTVGETLTTIDTPATPEKSTPKECQCPPREQPPPAPKSLPFPPTEDNVENLQNWLLDYYKTSTFNTCAHQTLPMMSGPPLRLMIDPAAKPVAKHKPIPIPIHWQQQVYAGLDQDCKLGVIEPVPVGTPVTWCHKMIIIAKKSGKPRRTVNMQALNDHAVRETHHTQSPYHQARSVPPNTYKTIFDQWNGYHSIYLHEDDRHLTTFITPKGRYRYKVAPQGYIASGDGYTRRFDEIVADFPRKTKCIDDSLLWSNTIEDAFYHAVDWLDLCGRNGIILNPSKFDFCKTTVTFAGFEISPTTVRPCPQQLEAIKNFPKPQNITDVRSWFGLINQVAYAFASAEHMLPFRNLLKPSTPFEWSEELDKLFEESKTTIINEIHRGVEIFDKEKPTCLATDWSKDGVGFWLFQQHCSCTTTKPFCCKDGWKITLVGSRFTSSTESRYAPIEGEALAVVEALKKARHFVLGCKHLIVATDHKPLLKVFSDRSLEDISNTRLVNLKEKTLQYRFQMIHIPGVKHAAADCLSRHPVSKAEHITLPDDIAVAEESIQAALPQTSLFLSKIRTHDRTYPEICYQSSIPTEIIKSVTWDDIRVATNSDQLMSLLIQTIEEVKVLTTTERLEVVQDHM